MNETINLTAAELIELLHLNDAIFQGINISTSMAEQILDKDIEEIYVEIGDGTTKLWTTKNWKAHSHNIQLGKEQEIKERRLWNLITESKSDLVKAIVEKIGLKQKDAEEFALKIIEKKKWKNVAIFLDEEKYKDLL